jgi:histidinol phosphatase-like enzyme
MKQNTLICLDRDDTILYDNKKYPGSTKDWKKKIRFLPSVIKGLKILSQLPNTKLYITTNQSGIPIKELPLLTMKRAREVDKHIISLLKKKGINIASHFISGHVTPRHVRAHPQFTFHKHLVKNTADIKPRPGLIKKALHHSKFPKNKTNIYIIGDRASDVQTALNISGFGILVPFSRTSEEKTKTKKLKGKNKHIAKDFLAAARWIAKQI